jgi:hypothetical protein
MIALGIRFGVRRARLAGVMGCVLLLVGLAPLAAQSPPPSDAPPNSDRPGDSPHGRSRNGDARPQPDLNDPEVRKKAREMFAKRLENRRREIEKLEQAMKMFDEGKSIEDLRSLFPDMPHPGQRAEQWMRRWEEGGPGSQSDWGTGRSQPAEPPHPLTAEEREVVREILAATAPKILDRIKELEKSKPADADQKLTETLLRSRSLLDLRNRDAAMYQLKLQEIRHGRQAGEAAWAIAELDAPGAANPPQAADSASAERRQKVEALRAALLSQYNIRTQIMRRDADRMTKDLAARDAQAADVVEKTIRDMIDREKRRRDKSSTEGDRHPGPGADHPSRPSAKDPASSRHD